MAGEKPDWFKAEEIPDSLRRIVKKICREYGVSRRGVKIVPIERYVLKHAGDAVTLEMGAIDFTIYRIPGEDPFVVPTPDGPGTYEIDTALLDDSRISYPITLDHVAILIPNVNATAIFKN